MKPGVVERASLIHVGDLPVATSQQIFVPDDEPGLLIDLTLHNVSPAAVHLTLNWLVRWDIQGAWWSHWPTGPTRPASTRNGEA